MMKRLLLYIIILVSLEGKAQIFTGRVEDMSGKPLASASVVAKGDGGSVVAFTAEGLQERADRQDVGAGHCIERGEGDTTAHP